MKTCRRCGRPFQNGFNAFCSTKCYNLYNNNLDSLEEARAKADIDLKITYWLAVIFLIGLAIAAVIAFVCPSFFCR